MSQSARQRHKETATTVFTGLIINYPLNLLGLYLCIDYFGMTDPFWIGTTITFYMTFLAYIRVFIIRSYFSK